MRRAGDMLHQHQQWSWSLCAESIQRAPILSRTMSNYLPWNEKEEGPADGFFQPSSLLKCRQGRTGMPLAGLHFIRIHRFCVSCKAKACGNPALSNSICHFSKSVCSLHIFASHIGNSHNTSHFIFINIFVSYDQWLWLIESSEDGSHFLAIIKISVLVFTQMPLYTK